jgi:uncharacterized membrane protein YhaH (DUF805 family)
MHYFLNVFKKYAVFTGRSNRAEFWCFYLINLVISLVLGFLLPFLSLIYALIVFVPSLSVGTRRLHDIEKSGWNILWSLTIVGIVVLIYWWAKEGTAGDNMYGPDPNF